MAVAHPRVWSWASIASLLVGCVERGVATTELVAATEAETSSAVPGSAGSQGFATEGGTSSGGDHPADPTTACPFICVPDGGAPWLECSLWDQDCPRGEKCMPWANDGGNAWNATKCTPLDDTPAGPGEPCTVVDSGVSGIDDCERGAMCWDADPETNVGECVAFCVGSEANPVCADPSAACTITGEGTLILCLPSCDPLAPDCREGAACYPDNSAFRCAPDRSGDAGAFGDPCEYLNVCDSGLFCAAADRVPGCRGDYGCCSEFCDLSIGDAMCTGAAQGQVCAPWFGRDQAPPAFENVGACVLPE